MLAVLALRAPDRVRQELLRSSVMRPDVAHGALQTAVTRARRVVAITDDPYGFAEQVTSDLVRFRDAYQEAITDPSPESVQRALALWGAGPLPRLRAVPEVRELVGLQEELVRLQLRIRRRRLLIVDDQIGDRLRALFGEHDATVISSLQQFWDLKDDLGIFDLALVDLHLQVDNVDQEGLVIVDHLARETSLPAILMTVQPAPGTDLQKVMRDYHLVSYVVKGAANTALRDAVGDALSTDPDAALLKRLGDGLPDRVRKAEKRLTARGAARAEFAKLEMDVERLWSVFTKGSLPLVQETVRAFDSLYGDPRV
ncbi:hypothetical protein SAMN05660199_02907 [Klenkia soli]|uniref:Uncharacterized protein n=1 Tax=Klenkia soli TaxID=1052260 RepID=A0A1H0NYP8_9ACTN|nr:hypothetical protein [Klenkia soli]SDO97656.1 hypothetical protein SAMN05660199_02907 [Klenkia soli]